MRCSLIDPRKSPLAPLFQRGVRLWDREELELVVRNSPFFSKGDKGGFFTHPDGRSLVEPMNSITTQSLEGEEVFFVQNA
jgi:hypothetical protein